MKTLHITGNQGSGHLPAQASSLRDSRGMLGIAVLNFRVHIVNLLYKTLASCLKVKQPFFFFFAIWCVLLLNFSLTAGGMNKKGLSSRLLYFILFSDSPSSWYWSRVTREENNKNECCEKPTPHSHSVFLPLQLTASQDWDGESREKSKTLTVYSDPGKHSKSVHKANSPQKFERQKGKIHTLMKSQTHSATHRKINLFAFCSSLSIFKQLLKSYFLSE